MRLASRLLLSLWAGVLLALGAVAAPMLFHELADRHLAGQLAGAMFRAATIGSLPVAALLAVAAWRQRSRSGPAAFMLPALLLAISEWGIRPLLEAARAEVGASATAFVLWHGVSTLLYAGATVVVVALLVAELRR